MPAILDPSETPRRYLANLTTRAIHRTDSKDPACFPRTNDPGATSLKSELAVLDELGWSDSLTWLEGQGLFPCRVCEPTRADDEPEPLRPPSAAVAPAPASVQPSDEGEED